MSKIVGCELVAQANLPFDFFKGACNTFRSSDEKALMCFGGSGQECHM